MPALPKPKATPKEPEKVDRTKRRDWWGLGISHNWMGQALPRAASSPPKEARNAKKEEVRFERQLEGLDLWFCI